MSSVPTAPADRDHPIRYQDEAVQYPPQATAVFRVKMRKMLTNVKKTTAKNRPMGKRKEAKIKRKLKQF